MAYLGNNIDAYQYTVEVSRFNGTGACTQFQIPQDVDDAKAIEVLVNSVQQDPDNSYTVVGGLITFTEAPSVGTDNILVLRREGTTFTRTQIDSGDILPNAVTTAAIADGSITASKIADGTIIAADIADGSITGPKLGQTAINANNIVNASITGAKLAANTVTGDVIGQTAINANNIVNGGVTVAKGGTGLSTLTANSVVLGNGTNPVQLIAPGTSGNVLTSNGNNWISVAAAATSNYVMQVFTTPGTWTKPAGLKAIRVTVIGGGGACGTSAGAGGTSSFGSPAFLSATGGAAATGAVTGAGGSGSGGQLNASGAPGFAPNQIFSGCQQFLGSFGGASAFGFGQNAVSGGPGSSVGLSYGGGGSRNTPFAGAAGGGGGAIEYLDAPALPGPQPYTVGAGGPGTPAPLNAAGAAGVVIVEEFY